METNSKARLQHIPLEELHTFKNHPFAVRRDAVMEQLIDSIRINGVLNPILTRPRSAGGYEIIAGHRRTEASRLLKKPTVPSFVCDMDDDHAIIAMFDSNLSQREGLLISEKAFALKMRTEAIRRIMLATPGKSEIGRASEGAAREQGISSRQAERLMQLTKLNRQLMNLVDEKKLTADAGGQLSYLSTEEQCWVYDCMKEMSIIPNTAQAKQLRELSVRNELTQENVAEILTVKKPIRKSDSVISKQETKPDIPVQLPTENTPPVASVPLSTENKRVEHSVVSGTSYAAEKALPILDYPRISQYYPPDTPVEYMNDDICRHLEASKRHRLYDY